MRRALQRAVGVLLATGVVGLARPALAQPSSYLVRGARTPIQTVQYEEITALSEGHSRLEEMKVRLALLSDVATFPYYLGARAAGEMLDLRGYVPNSLVRQRAVDLARRSTFLSVTDSLKIQTNLSTRPSLRGVEILNKEGAELLAKHLGEAGKQMHLEARPNGLIAVRGRIGSVEEKVAISQLFRQLPGCSGVLNQLTVQPISRDGQNIVKVTRDGEQTVPFSALGMEPEEVTPEAAPPLTPTAPTPIAETVRPAPTVPSPNHPKMLPPKEPAKLPAPQPAIPLPTALPRLGSDTRDRELQLPKILPAKPLNNSSASSIGTTDQTVYPKIKTVKADGVEMPTPLAPTAPAKQKSSKPTRANKSDTFATDPTSAHGSAPASADALLAPKPPNKWSRPIAPETEKPKITVKPAPTPVKAHPIAPTVILGSASVPSETTAKRPALPTPTTPTDSSALRPVRHWPPAYAPASADTNKGRAGIIVFEDDPAPEPVAKPVIQPHTTGGLHPIVPEELKRQVMTVCGRQAREVTVEKQRDGSVLVKVKVANARAERQVLNKILTIPAMSAPNVHLATDLGR